MEDNDQARMLRESLELAKENNRLLRRMRRDAFWGRIFSLLFWGVTLGLPVLLYYFYVYPYIHALQTSYQGLEQNANQMQSIEGKLPPWAKDWFDKAFSSTSSTSTR